MRIIIDGGGTSTDVAVSISGNIIARTQLPSFKPVGKDHRTDDLCRALGGWLASLGGDAVEPSWVLVGMAGVWTEDEKQQYVNHMVDSWFEYINVLVPRISVISDVELAHLAAHGTATGIVLVAGTGSIAVARMNDQRLLRCGGWGPLVDDAGSGTWIGKEALRAVARMIDGRGPATELIRAIAVGLAADAENPPTIAAALHGKMQIDYARFAQSTLALATSNDAVALGIREHAAEELSQLVFPLAEQSLKELATLEPGTLRIAYAGSLFKDNEFAEAVSMRIANEFPEAVMRRVEDVPAEASKVFDV